MAVLEELKNTFVRFGTQFGKVSEKIYTSLRAQGQPDLSSEIKDDHNMKNILDSICSQILAIDTEGPLIVAIDGIDGSGKSRFAASLAKELTNRNRHVLHTSVDNFHNKESIRKPPGKPLPVSFFEDSYNYQVLIDKLLAPLRTRSASKVFLKHFNHRIDSEVHEDPVDYSNDTILVFDGIFLHRDELSSYWDFSIFLDVSFEEAYRRMAVRDGCPEDFRDEKNSRYYEGQLLYLERCEPKRKASVVIDNNDFDKPVLCAQQQDFG